LADKKEIKQEITIGSATEQKWQLDAKGLLEIVQRPLAQ
jgi:hypothetical protein